MAKKIIPIFFFVFLLAFSLGEVARFILPNGVAIKAIDAATLFFVVVSIFTFRKHFKKPKLTKPILIFLSIAVLSLIANYRALKIDELYVASLYLLRWAMYAGVYFIVFNFDNSLKKKVPGLLLIAGSFIMLLGFVQYLFYPNLRNLYYLGWDEHLYRLFSTFLDPNYAGAFFVLFFLVILGVFMKKRSWPLGVLGVLDLIAIILTYSRSSYLMLLVGVFIFLLLKGQKKILLVFVILFAVGISVFSVFGLKSEGTNLLRITSSEARIPSAKNAIAIFQNNPILGVGFNAYEYASRRYGLARESKFDNHAAAGTDNSFLFILSTTGVLGLAAYFYLLFKIISVSKKSAVVLSSVIALAVDSLFINSLFYSFIMLWMWILLGASED